MTNAALAIQAGTSYLDLRVDWANGNITNGVNGYGTGPGYIDNILKCEKCMKQKETSGCKDKQACLHEIHP